MTILNDKANQTKTVRRKYSTEQLLEMLIEKIGETEIMKYYRDNVDIDSFRIWYIIPLYYEMCGEPKSDEYFNGVEADNSIIYEDFLVHASNDGDKSLLDAYTLNKTDLSEMTRYIQELAEIHNIVYNPDYIKNTVPDDYLDNLFTDPTVAHTIKNSKINENELEELLYIIEKKEMDNSASAPETVNKIDTFYNYKLLYTIIPDDLKITSVEKKFQDRVFKYDRIVLQPRIAIYGIPDIAILIKTLETHHNKDILSEYLRLQNLNDENISELKYLATETQDFMNSINK